MQSAEVMTQNFCANHFSRKYIIKYSVCYVIVFAAPVVVLAA